jgi:hypothetical protein
LLVQTNNQSNLHPLWLGSYFFKTKLGELILVARSKQTNNQSNLSTHKNKQQLQDILPGVNGTFVPRYIFVQSASHRNEHCGRLLSGCETDTATLLRYYRYRCRYRCRCHAFTLPLPFHHLLLPTTMPYRCTATPTATATATACGCNPATASQ